MRKVSTREEFDALAGKRKESPKTDESVIANRELLAGIVEQQKLLASAVVSMARYIQKPPEQKHDLVATIERDSDHRMTKVLIQRK